MFLAWLFMKFELEKRSSLLIGNLVQPEPSAFHRVCWPVIRL